MKKTHRAAFLMLGAILAVGLSGCPPLDHKIYVRNITSDTVHLTFIYASLPDTSTITSIPVRAVEEIIPIQKKTLVLLDKKLDTSVKQGNIKLAIPPQTTAYVSDIIDSFYLFADKLLVVQSANAVDTLVVNYPYKDMKNIKRKVDPAYNYFYRTLIHYDIE